MMSEMDKMLASIMKYEEDLKTARGVGKTTRAEWDARFRWLFRRDAETVGNLSPAALAEINNDWLLISSFGWSAVSVFNPDNSIYLTVPALFAGELLSDVMSKSSGEPRKALMEIVQGGNVPEPFMGERAISAMERAIGSSDAYTTSAVDAMARHRVDVVRQVASMAAAAGVEGADKVLAIINGNRTEGTHDQSETSEGSFTGWSVDD